MTIKLFGFTITITKIEKKEVFVPVINKTQSAQDVAEITNKFNLADMKVKAAALRTARASQ